MNWGYWGSVGVVKDTSYRDRMEQAGVGSIEPEEAMNALDRLLQGPLDQLGLVKTIEDLKDDRSNGLSPFGHKQSTRKVGSIMSTSSEPR